MDNLTHTLAATALAKTRWFSGSPRVAAALVVAANAPDVDGVLRFWPDLFREQHRGVSHSIVGLVVEAAALAVMFAARDARLLTAIVVGLASHPALDFLNTYGIRPWLPFDGRWIYGDTLFVVDPWIWLLLGGATALAGPRTRWGSATLTAALGLTSWVVFTNERSSPTIARIWAAGVLVLAVARATDVGRARPDACIAVFLSALALYVAALAGLGARAEREGVEAIRPLLPPGETVVATSRSPEAARPFEWTVLVETERAVYRRMARVGSDPTSLVRYEKNFDDPLVARALLDPKARRWRSFARYPIAFVREEGGRRYVDLFDARYLVSGVPQLFSVRIPVSP
ncbi:MAG TPA: metal-dependent hydrolase [Planctomycetota bacterium]|nr:metal-dependent hydrolase [Planctomycetota bacterium]